MTTCVLLSKPRSIRFRQQRGSTLQTPIGCGSSARAPLRLRPPPPPIWLDNSWRRRQIYIFLDSRRFCIQKVVYYLLESIFFFTVNNCGGLSGVSRFSSFRCELMIFLKKKWINRVSDVGMFYSLATDPSSVCRTRMKQNVCRPASVQTTVATGLNQAMKNSLSKLTCIFQISPSFLLDHKIWNQKLCQAGTNKLWFLYCLTKRWRWTVLHWRC